MPACVANTAPENPNMLHTRLGAIGTDKSSVPGWETVRIQDPVGTQCKVLSDDMQYAFATALLDQLEDYGTDFKEHHRRLRTSQYPTNPKLRLILPRNSEYVNLACVPPYKIQSYDSN